MTTPEDDYRASLQPLVGSCWNETFAPLREAAEPLVDNSDVVPYEILHEMGTLLHSWGRKYVHRSVFIDELTDDLHEFILERTKAAPGRMDGIGTWPMGEAVGSGNSSAFAWSDKAHLIVIEAAWESHDNRAHIEWAPRPNADYATVAARGRIRGTSVLRRAIGKTGVRRPTVIILIAYKRSNTSSIPKTYLTTQRPSTPRTTDS